MLWVVGVGVCRGHLTENAKKIIERADVVYGSSRAFELADVDDGKRRVLKNFKEFDEITKEGEMRDVVVLSTGDPMVAGLGRKFRGAMIEPGISSVQVALAKLGVDLTDVVVVDAHARDFDASLLELLKYRHLLILADRGFDARKLGNRKVVLLENLCMGDERVRKGFAGSVEVASDYTIIFVERVGELER